MNVKFEQLKRLRDQVLECKKCGLWETRQLPVVGQGNHNADVVFVGEAPGMQEDQTGKPFVGQAGKVLDSLLTSIGFNRLDIYICNLIKCRPPMNRNPLAGEIDMCGDFLKTQLAVIEPKIVVTLGKFAMDYVFQEYDIMEKKNSNYVGRFKGQVYQAKDFKIIPQYHPATAVYSSSKLPEMIQDFQKIKEVLEKS